MTSKVLKELYLTVNPVMFLMGLKNLNFDEAYKKINQCYLHPITKSLLNQKNTFPKNYKDIRNVTNNYFTNNLEGELAWLLKSIIIHKDSLNSFYNYEERFQQNILLNNYDEALTIVNIVNSEICHSYWGMENTFSLKDRENGNNDNWNFLKKINEDVTESMSLLFSEFFSKKAEKEVSTFQYKRELENIINGLDNKDTEIFIFRLGSIFYNDYKNLDILVFIENYSSIIDKYLALIEILYILSNNRDNNTIVEKVLLELKKNGFKDHRIDRLLEFNRSTKEIKDFDINILNLFDRYSEGQYILALEESKILINEKPSCYELFEIYVKCLLELKSDFVETHISKNIDEILKSLYIIYSKGDNFYEAEENLIKFYLNFPKCDFSKQLISHVLNISGSKLSNTLNDNLHFAYSKYSNPKILTGESEGQFFNLELLEKHLSLKINFLISIGDFDSLNKISVIPDFKKKIYSTRIGFHFKDKFNRTVLENLMNDKNLAVNSFEEVLTYYFKYCIESDKISELLEILVNAYFKNKFLLRKLKTDELISQIIDKDYYYDQANINLPIFFYINNSESYFQFASLDTYLTSVGISKPSDLTFIENDGELDKKIYLLEKVCNLEVLNKFYSVFENDEEILDERINILRILISINDISSYKYFEEIAVISRKKRIDSTIQNYNDGKISLNFDGIRDENTTSLETSFNRFIKLRDFTEKHDLKVIEADILIKRYLDEFLKREDKFQDASFVAFKSIFLEIVDLFLFSKEHGLDGDLSTRIRHGVLENKLRFVFSNNDLISTKNNDIYGDVEYWISLCKSLDYLPEISDEIQTVIQEFSQKVDNLIYLIKNDYIQIKSYKHHSKERAFFNYIFNEEYLWILYKEVNDSIFNYPDFQNYCFDILKIYSENILKQISKIIQQEIKAEFLNLLDDFEIKIDLVNKIGGDVHSELKQKIKYAKTQIENELMEISKWFKLTTFFDVETLDIETIVLTSLEIINNNNDFKIIPKITFPKNNYLVENGYSYIEIFKILFENALKHSKVEISQLDLIVNIDEPLFVETQNDDISLVLKFSISNNINDEVAKNCNMKYISENWDSSLINVNIEGGSGYQKINRLLKYNIKVIDSYVKFKITNNKFYVEFTTYLIYKPI